MPPRFGCLVRLSAILKRTTWLPARCSFFSRRRWAPPHRGHLEKNISLVRRRKRPYNGIKDALSGSDQRTTPASTSWRNGPCARSRGTCESAAARSPSISKRRLRKRGGLPDLWQKRRGILGSTMPLAVQCTASETAVLHQSRYDLRRFTHRLREVASSHVADL